MKTSLRKVQVPTNVLTLELTPKEQLALDSIMEAQLNGEYSEHDKADDLASKIRKAIEKSMDESDDIEGEG